MNRSAGIAFFRLDFLLNFFITVYHASAWKKVEINSDCYCPFHTFLPPLLAFFTNDISFNSFRRHKHPRRAISLAQTPCQRHKLRFYITPIVFVPHPQRDSPHPFQNVSVSHPLPDTNEFALKYLQTYYTDNLHIQDG
jgi:hypothetical protein